MLCHLRRKVCHQQTDLFHLLIPPYGVLPLCEGLSFELFGFYHIFPYIATVSNKFFPYFGRALSFDTKYSGSRYTLWERNSEKRRQTPAKLAAGRAKGPCKQQKKPVGAHRVRFPPSFYTFSRLTQHGGLRQPRLFPAYSRQRCRIRGWGRSPAHA